MTENVETGVSVDDELTNHKSCLTEWVGKVSEITFPKNKTNVINRFVRDCNMLVSDIDGQSSVSVDDMCDFDDRRSSLEVQFHSLTEGRA